MKIDLDDLHLVVAGRDDLIAMKRVSGRPIDRTDILALTEPDPRPCHIHRVPIASITIDAEFPDQPARDPLGALDRLLDVLARRSVRATFFIVGAWAQANPQHVAKIAGAGHQLGNHSYSHRSLPTMTEAEIVDDLTSCHDILAGFGIETRPWFRAPRGELGQARGELSRTSGELGQAGSELGGQNSTDVAAAIKHAGYRHIHWHARGEDWRPELSAEDVANTVFGDVQKRWPSPAIVLLHSWPDSAPKALELVIDQLGAGGARFLTVHQLGRRHAAVGRLRALASALQTSHQETG